MSPVLLCVCAARAQHVSTARACASSPKHGTTSPLLLLRRSHLSHAPPCMHACTLARRMDLNTRCVRACMHGGHVRRLVLPRGPAGRRRQQSHAQSRIELRRERYTTYAAGSHPCGAATASVRMRGALQCAVQAPNRSNNWPRQGTLVVEAGGRRCCSAAMGTPGLRRRARPSTTKNAAHTYLHTGGTAPKGPCGHPPLNAGPARSLNACLPAAAAQGWHTVLRGARGSRQAPMHACTATPRPSANSYQLTIPYR